MTSRLFVHIPAQQLRARLPFLLNRRLQPEVACQDAHIDRLDLASLTECAETLAAEQLRTTLHAPFSGFNPASGSQRERKKAQRLCEQSLHLAKILRARRIVFHPGLPPNATPRQQERWLTNSLEFWPEQIDRAADLGTVITLENIYESSSLPFFRLFEQLGSTHFGHCFDVGHWNMFATESLAEWFARLGRQTYHLHLHDNHGRQDEHLPIGSGMVDFGNLFDQISHLSCPPSMTLEAHRPEDLELSLEALQPYLQEH